MKRKSGFLWENKGQDLFNFFLTDKYRLKQNAYVIGVTQQNDTSLTAGAVAKG